MRVGDLYYLQVALTEAKKAAGCCAPNPAVGAVLVRDGQIIARGYHRGPGSSHAEVDALSQISDAKGATLYVTLEPCCHQGRTPPCTDVIIRAGIRHVVFAVRDLNRHIADTGEACLLRAGISCEQISVPEIETFYQPYLYWVKTKKPWCLYKIAMDTRGIVAGPLGETISLTGEACHTLTHEGRLFSDALLTSGRTILHDDPALNIRLSATPIAKPVVVIDPSLKTPPGAKIFHTTRSVTIFYAEPKSTEIKERLIAKGAQLISFTTVEEIFIELGRLGFHRVWIEAGATLWRVLSPFLQECLIYLIKKPELALGLRVLDLPQGMSVQGYTFLRHIAVIRLSRESA